MGAVRRPSQFSNKHMTQQRHITPNLFVTFAQVQLPPGNTKVNSSHLCRVLEWALTECLYATQATQCYSCLVLYTGLISKLITPPLQCGNRLRGAHRVPVCPNAILAAVRGYQALSHELRADKAVAIPAHAVAVGAGLQALHNGRSLPDFAGDLWQLWPALQIAPGAHPAPHPRALDRQPRLVPARICP